MTTDADHHAVQLLLGQGAEGTDAQLAAQHCIECVRLCTASLVAQLQAFYSSVATSFLGVLFLNRLRHHSVQVDLRDIDVTVIVSLNSHDITKRQVFGQTFCDDDHTIVFAFVLSSQHRFHNSLGDAAHVHALASLRFTGFGCVLFVDQIAGDHVFHADY